MTPKALKALRGSIRKWQKIVKGAGIDFGADNCPLCKAYPKDSCKGCPVQKFTGKANCEDTPYYTYKGALRATWISTWSPAYYAQKELDFLKSLLPKKRKKK